MAADYIWRPKGLPVRAQGVAIEPILAFKHFVLPGVRNEGWIEDSSKVAGTGMSKREWAGLIIHAIALMDLTGDNLQIAKMVDNDDGGLVRNDTEAVYVEQTLATYRDGKYQNLLEAITGQIQSKSSHGQNYADNRHLIVFCNMTGDMQEKELNTIVSGGIFNIVNVIGFNGDSRNYISLVFDKDKKDGPIHRCAIRENNLIEASSKLPD